MYGNQIHRILYRDPITAPTFQGVFSSDQIPSLHPRSHIVVNLDSAQQPGSHWLALYTKNENHLEFFDSLGQSPEFYGGNILSYTAQFPVVQFNSNSFQSVTSNVCGQYCIYYLLRRCQGQSMEAILSDLCRNVNNDYRMYQFVKMRYGVKVVYKK